MRTKLLLVTSLLIAVSLLFSSCSLFRSAEKPNPAASAATTGDSSTSADTEYSETTASTEASTDEPDYIPPVIPVKKPGDPLTVCIDAGHGYVDPGCTTKYLDGRYERDIVAEYADTLKAELEDMGYRVILLRNDDDYVDAERIATAAKSLGMSFMEDKLADDSRFAPYNRSVWANVLHRDTYIDLFVSIHIDSFESMESVRGTRIYYCTENAYSGKSKELCDSLSSAVAGKLPDTNARSFPKNAAEAYVVTKHTEMPSVLIEMGFATNPDDAANILDTEWRDSFCASIAEGIKAYSGN